MSKDVCLADNSTMGVYVHGGFPAREEDFSPGV